MRPLFPEMVRTAIVAVKGNGPDILVLGLLSLSRNLGDGGCRRTHSHVQESEEANAVGAEVGRD